MKMGKRDNPPFGDTGNSKNSMSCIGLRKKTEEKGKNHAFCLKKKKKVHILDSVLNISLGLEMDMA